MRTTLGIVTALTCIIVASVGISWAAAPRANQPASVVSGTPTHVLAYEATGPVSKCEGNECSGQGHIVRVSMPSGAAKYSCTMTLSFDLTTTGTAHFAIKPVLWAAGLKTKKFAPGTGPLAPAVSADSRTVVFRPELLDGGKHYNLVLDLDINDRGSAPQTATISHLLVDIEATPVG